MNIHIERSIKNITFQLVLLTEEERKLVLSNFCSYCGKYLIDDDGKYTICHCMNDE